MCELDGPGTCQPTPDFQRIREDAQSCSACWGIIPDGAHMVPDDGTACACKTPSRTLPADAFTEAFWAALPDNCGLQAGVDGTGGGCQAFIVRKEGHPGAIYVTDGNLDVDFNGADDVAVWYPDEDDQDALEILTSATPAGVAQAAREHFNLPEES